MNFMQRAKTCLYPHCQSYIFYLAFFYLARGISPKTNDSKPLPIKSTATNTQTQQQDQINKMKKSPISSIAFLVLALLAMTAMSVEASGGAKQRLGAPELEQGDVTLSGRGLGQADDLFPSMGRKEASRISNKLAGKSSARKCTCKTHAYFPFPGLPGYCQISRFGGEPACGVMRPSACIRHRGRFCHYPY